MKTKLPPKGLSLTAICRREFQPEARAFATREGETGGISGIGNRAGEIDSYSTIIDPESPCFAADAIDKFLKMGVFLANHNLLEPPIGYFNSANIEGRDFKFDATYHSTDFAQEMRAIADERSKAGKTVAFSMGFYVANYEYFENGADLVAALASRKRNLSLWNLEQISAYIGSLWIMQVGRIVEVSQVNMASNEPSEADSVRGVQIARDDETVLLEIPIPKGGKITPGELLEIARDAELLEEPGPVATVDGTHRIAIIDELIARDPFKKRRKY